MICPKCNYEWENRASSPKRCPNPKCQHALFEYPEPMTAEEVAYEESERQANAYMSQFAGDFPDLTNFPPPPVIPNSIASKVASGEIVSDEKYEPNSDIDEFSQPITETPDFSTTTTAVYDAKTDTVNFEVEPKEQEFIPDKDLGIS